MTINSCQKTYFCEYLDYAISGVAARNCNYSNLENYTCNHDGKPCVAKEGLIFFAQKLSESMSAETSSEEASARACKREILGKHEGEMATLEARSRKFIKTGLKKIQ